MGANAFYPQPLLSFNKQLKPGKSILSLREIADWPSPFGIQKNSCKYSYLRLRTDGSGGDRPPWKCYAAGRTDKGDVNELPQSSDGKVSRSSNKDQIIALSRRIKSSISKGEAVRTKKRNPRSSEKPTVEQIKDTSSIEDVPKEEQQIQNKEPVTDFKLTRLPSNFVKRSPIPSASVLRGKVLVLNHEPSANKESSKQLKFPRVEELKLPQLKELAKARGIKGYSRMRKSKLVEMLRS